MTAYVKLGICKSQLDPLDCDGVPDDTVPGLVYCGMTDVEENPVLTDGLDLNDPSGMPNRDCVKVKIDPELDYYEIVITTCSLYDTRIDAMAGYSDEMILADGTSIGSMAKRKNGQNCICACGEDSCQKGVALTIWSLALCEDGSRHPDGQYAVTVYPALQFRPNTFTRTKNRELNGRQYLAIGLENPQFGQGPGDVIPADFAPFDRCQYEFLSDVCPPGDCDCGGCSAETPEPLPVVGVPVVRARTAAASTASIPAGATPAPAGV